MRAGTDAKLAGLAATVFAALAAIVPSGASAAFPGENGRIAFWYVIGPPGIFTIQPDGSDERLLIDAPGREEAPSWAPDGERLVFARGADDGTSIWTVDAQGGDLTRVITADASDEHVPYTSPSFSPDGRRIVYLTRDAIRTVRIDGSDPHRILGVGEMPKGRSAFLQDVVWSPDGKRIAFVRGLGWGRFNGIWTVRPNGSHLRRLTAPDRPSWDESPDFSPDGRHIVFERRRDELLRIRADGSGERPIQGQFPFSFQPAYAPAGDLIVAVRLTAFSKVDRCSDLYLTSPSAGAPTEITDNCPPSGPYVIDPDWQPVPAV